MRSKNWSASDFADTPLQNLSILHPKTLWPIRRPDVNELEEEFEIGGQRPIGGAQRQRGGERDLAFCISPPCLSMVDGLVQKTEEAYSATAIWATRRFDIFERLALLPFTPCLVSDSPIGLDVGKEAWAAGG